MVSSRAEFIYSNLTYYYYYIRVVCARYARVVFEWNSFKASSHSACSTYLEVLYSVHCTHTAPAAAYK